MASKRDMTIHYMDGSQMKLEFPAQVPNHTRVCLLLLAVHVLGACSHSPQPPALIQAKASLEELRDAVRREVHDPERAELTLELVDEMNTLTREASADMKAYVAAMRSLNADFDASEEQLRAASLNFNVRRDALLARALALNERAKAILTSDEWNALGHEREQALRKAIEAGTEM